MRGGAVAQASACRRLLAELQGCIILVVAGVPQRGQRCHRPACRAHLAVQPLQLGAEVWWEEVAASGSPLTPLDEGWAGALQRDSAVGGEGRDQMAGGRHGQPAGAMQRAAGHTARLAAASEEELLPAQHTWPP